MFQCPYQMPNEDGKKPESCEFEGTLREVERHRHEEHGDPKWDVAFDNPPGESP